MSYGQQQPQQDFSRDEYYSNDGWMSNRSGRGGGRGVVRGASAPGQRGAKPAFRSQRGAAGHNNMSYRGGGGGGSDYYDNMASQYQMYAASWMQGMMNAFSQMQHYGGGYQQRGPFQGARGRGIAGRGPRFPKRPVPLMSLTPFGMPAGVGGGGPFWGGRGGGDMRGNGNIFDPHSLNADIQKIISLKRALGKLQIIPADETDEEKVSRESRMVSLQLRIHSVQNKIDYRRTLKSNADRDRQTNTKNSEKSVKEEEKSGDEGGEGEEKEAVVVAAEDAAGAVDGEVADESASFVIKQAWSDAELNEAVQRLDDAKAKVKEARRDKSVEKEQLDALETEANSLRGQFNAMYIRKKWVSDFKNTSKRLFTNKDAWNEEVEQTISSLASEYETEIRQKIDPSDDLKKQREDEFKCIPEIELQIFNKLFASTGQPNMFLEFDEKYLRHAGGRRDTTEKEQGEEEEEGEEDEESVDEDNDDDDEEFEESANGTQ